MIGSVQREELRADLAIPAVRDPARRWRWACPRRGGARDRSARMGTSTTSATGRAFTTSPSARWTI